MRPTIVRSTLLLMASAALGCAAEVSPPPACTPLEQTCEGDQLSTCAADGRGATLSPCPSGCQGRACRACWPGAARCEGAARLVCDAAGATWTSVTCATGCEAATGGCRAPVCTPGAVQCTGKSLSTCTADGAGVTETACPYGCDPTTTPPSCRPAACAAGEVRCSPADPKLVETCRTDGTGWVSATLCPGSCAGGACQAPPTCTPGEEVCRQNVASGRDEIDRCAADGRSWQVAVTVCTTGSCVAAGGTPPTQRCGDCWQGERTCRGNEVFECTDPAAGPASLVACDGPYVCVAGACAAPISLGADPLAGYQTLAQAFVKCWSTFAGETADAMCYVLDGQSQPAALTFEGLKSWVCDAADVADLEYGQIDLDVARDLVGCGVWNNSEIDWSWDPLPPGRVLEACVWYHPSGSILFDDEDTLDRCERFAAGP